MKNIARYLILAGLDPRKPLRFFGGLPRYMRDRRAFGRASNGDFPFGKAYPMLSDKQAEGGTMKGHYFHQDLLVARRIWEANPARHIDIGSRIDGFVAHLAVFRQVEVFDIRPAESRVANILFRQADLMNLPEGVAGSCESISSLHAIEHFGLGRYGDPVDPDGHLKAIANIRAMLRDGGKFYFSVPIGPQRVEFNAHRVFSVGYLLRTFEGRFAVERFSYVDDAGDLHENVAPDPGSYGCSYGCGIFELRAV